LQIRRVDRVVDHILHISIIKYYFKVVVNFLHTLPQIKNQVEIRKQENG
jgi:hypothetical protein